LLSAYYLAKWHTSKWLQLFETPFMAGCMDENNW